MTEQQADPHPADAQHQDQPGQQDQPRADPANSPRRPPRASTGSTSIPGPYGPPPYRRLTRTRWDAPISGVCGGLARYFGVDPTLIRVLTVIGVVVTFPVGLIAYVVAWAVIPKE